MRLCGGFRFFQAGIARMETDKTYMARVFSGELLDAQIVASLLEDAGVDCFLAHAVRASYGPAVSSGQEVEVYVRERESEEALGILRKDGYAV